MVPAPSSHLLTDRKGGGGHVTFRALLWSELSDQGFSTVASAAAFQVQPWPAGILALPSYTAPRHRAAAGKSQQPQPLQRAFSFVRCFFFLHGFSRTTTVDPPAISVTAAHRSWPATAPALPLASNAWDSRAPRRNKRRRSFYLSVLIPALKAFSRQQALVILIHPTVSHCSPVTHVMFAREQYLRWFMPIFCTKAVYFMSSFLANHLFNIKNVNMLITREK